MAPGHVLSWTPGEAVDAAVLPSSAAGDRRGEGGDAGDERGGGGEG